MSRMSFILALAATVAVATAAPLPLREGWRLAGPAPAGERVEMILALPQVGADWLDETFEAVSNPDSPRYGDYVDHETLAKHVYGESRCLEHVTSHLDQHEITYRKTRDGAHIVLEMNVTEASQLLQAEFFTFAHDESMTIAIRTTKDELPSELADHIVFAMGHSYRTLGRPQRGAQISQNLGTTPASINSAYSLNGYTSTNGNNSQAIASFLKQYFSPKDLAQFQKQFKLPERPIDKVVGKNIEAFPGAEASLDVEYISATGRNISTWFISTSRTANKGQEDFLYWIMGQTNDTSSPWVHSVSYGDVEATIPIEYKTQVDMEFKKMGTLGRSILIAAGDSGVGCNSDKTFQPDWPTSCPFITSVGGSSGSPERVWSDGGGGFSNTYGTPDYQADAVKAYLNSGVAPASSYFNASGRAYPDVAAFATGFEIVIHGTTLGVDGTSCATPTFAGVVSALNDVRMAAGKPTLGFLNPLLYKFGSSSPQGFNDITQGSNPNFQCPGFQATKGWDPASGWGSPNFSALRQLVLQQ